MDGKPVVKQPKTESGTRTLDVPEILMKKLKAYKVKCMEQKIRVGRRLLEEDFIIVHPDGKPIYPEYVISFLQTAEIYAMLSEKEVPYAVYFYGPIAGF